MKKNNSYVYGLALLAVMFWGISYVWTSVVYKYYQPITTMFIRLSFSAVLLMLALKLFMKKEKIQKSDYLKFALLGFFSPFLYFLGESFGLKFVTPTLTSVIIGSIPVFTPIAGFVFLRERLSVFNISGFLISFVGIVLMVVDKNFSFNASPYGLLCLFGAVVVAIISSVLLKKMTSRYSSLLILTYQNIVGALCFLPLFLIFDFNSFMSVRPNTELISSLALLIVFSSCLAFLFYTISVKEIGVSKTSVFTNLIPIFTALFSFLIIGEDIDALKMTGIIVVIAGVFMAQAGKKWWGHFKRIVFSK